MVDLRKENILLCFGRTDMSIGEVLAMENAEHLDADPQRDVAYDNPEENTSIYHGRRIKYAKEGDVLDLSTMKVQIADFGYGSGTF
jgi:hypothetical protein